MVKKMKILRFLIIIFFLSLSASAQQHECFLIMAGKETTVNGQILLAHNNDLTGKEASMLEKIPQGKEMIVLSDSINNNSIPFSILVVEIYKGFDEGDAAAINEFGVAIAGGLSMKNDRSKFADSVDPLIKSGLGGGIRYFALQHARTARECVRIIGECYDKFGVSYPSGIGIADSNEIWYFETGGGHSWAAVRIPNDCFFVAANSYRIQDIDFNDTLNYMFSSNLPDLYEKYVKPKNHSAKFNFSKFFGGGVKEKQGNNYYNSRRVWRAIKLLNPSLKLKADSDNFPFFVHPKEQISKQTLFSILRDYYTDTEYYIFKNKNRNKPERAIATWNGVHTEVIEIIPGLPVEYGSILWAGLSSPFTAVYLPFYFGINIIPISYLYAPNSYNKKSAFWIFKKLGDLSRSNYPQTMSQWILERSKFEANIINLQNSITNSATMLNAQSKPKLIHFLNSLVNSYTKGAVNLAKTQIEKLEKK